MHVLKNAAKRGLSAFGYEIHRTGKHPHGLLGNFANLSQAYEQRLNELDGNSLIAPSEIRPMLLARLLGTPPSEAYFIVHGLAKTSDVEGDVCEFGVAQGETSALIANEIGSTSTKGLHLFDSFEGLPRPSDKDRLKDDIFSLGSMEAYAGKMACPEDMVRARLEAISFARERYVIHKGFFEQLIRVDERLPRKVSFAYVDFDFYEPTKLVLHFLHEVTSIGAMIIVDDYDYFSTGVKTAVDEFIEESGATTEPLYELLLPNSRYGRFAVLTRKG